MKSLLIIITGLVCFTSCEKEIFLDEDESSPRVVVNSKFTHDSTWRINLSESRPLLTEGELDYISNATIKLLNESDAELGTFSFDTGGNYKLSSPTPLAGSTYKITADIPGHETVSATSYVPKEVDYVTIDTTSNYTNYQMDFKINIQDEANVPNYYSLRIIGASFSINPETMDTNYYEGTGMSTFEPYVANGYADIITNEKYAEEFLFSDELFDGDLIEFNVSSYLVQQESGSFYKVILESMSEEAYKYGLSLNKYYEASGDFFAEPVQVISNIDNGMGIFGGYSSFVDTLWVD